MPKPCNFASHDPETRAKGCFNPNSEASQAKTDLNAKDAKYYAKFAKAEHGLFAPFAETFASFAFRLGAPSSTS